MHAGCVCVCVFAADRMFFYQNLPSFSPDKEVEKSVYHWHQPINAPEAHDMPMYNARVMVTAIVHKLNQTN